MIGYGLAKSAVHHLVRSLGVPDGGLPPNATVVGLLPCVRPARRRRPVRGGAHARLRRRRWCSVMLDTPMNRKWMAPGTDTSTWTPLPVVAEQLHAWAVGQARPPSGSLVVVATHGGQTAFTNADAP